MAATPSLSATPTLGPGLKIDLPDVPFIQQLWTLGSENPVLLLALVGQVVGAAVRFWAGLPGPGNLIQQVRP